MTSSEASPSYPPPPPPPDGFIQVLRAPFINHVGPLLQAVENPLGSMTLGIWVGEVHCNTLGFMHGGMIATLCDSAMARSIQPKLQRRTVTLKMQLEYFDAIMKGDWLEAHARLVSEDGEVAHTECEVRVGGAMRARGTAVFRLLRKM
jgi:acyl-coenzyme A thioesterase PaaI-like protein